MRDRKVIDDLIAAIEKKWEMNYHKGESWKQMTDREAMALLHAEEDELLVDVIKRSWDTAMDEAADVAICAAFLASKRSNCISFPLPEGWLLKH